MIVKTTRHVIEAIAAIIAAAAVGLGVLAWLVASGPVSLGVFEQTIEGALSGALPPGQKVEFEKAYVHWARNGRALRLRVVDMRILDTDGETAASFPEVDLGFSVSALGRGLIAPTRVIFKGSKLQIVRENDGAIRLGVRPHDERAGGSTVPAQPVPAPQETGEADVLSGLIDQLLAPADRHARLGYLKTVSIQDAGLTLHDTNLGAAFTAPAAALELNRTEEGLDLSLDATFAVGGHSSEVSVRGAFDAQSRKSDLRLAFTDVNPADFADLSEKLSWLTRFDIPVRGSVTFEAVQGRIPDAIDVTLNAGKGHVVSPIVRIPLRREVLKLAGANLAASVDLSTGRIELQKLDYEVGGNTGIFRGHAIVELNAHKQFTVSRVGFALKGTGIAVDVPGYSERPAEIESLSVDGAWMAEEKTLTIDRARLKPHGAALEFSGDVAYGGELAIRLQGSLYNLYARYLMNLWPEMTARGARDWISDNVKDGRIVKGTFELDAPAGTFSGEALPNEALTVEFQLSDMVTHFVPGLPPMTDLEATAVLQGNRFDLTVDTARIGAVKILGGGMALDSLVVRGTPASFHAEVDGPMTDILSILDMGPLGYPSRYGIDPDGIGGGGRIDLELTLPLLRYLKIEQIEFAAKGKTRGLVMPGILAGRDLTDGNVEIEILPSGLTGKGDLVFSGIPLTATWREDFRGLSDTPTFFQVSGTLDDGIRSNLGLDTDYVQGPIGFTVTAQGRGQEMRTIKLRTDFKDAEFIFPGVDWKKQAGDVGAGDLTVNFGENDALSVDDIVIASKDILVRGGFQLAPDYRLMSADFEQIKLGPVMDLSVTAQRTDNRLGVTMRGERLHAGPFLDALTENTGASQRPVRESKAEEDRKGAPFSIDAQIAALALKAGVLVKDVSLKLNNNGHSIEKVTLNGAFEGGGTVYGNLDRFDDTRRTLTITASDAGPLVNGLLDMDSIRDGRLTLKARVLEDQSGMRIKGRLSVEEFRLVNTPFFARLLTVASFVGLNDLLQGEGIRFKKLQLPFESRDHIWTFEEASAYGPSLGITLEGRFDENQLGTDLRGTLVPAYSLNQVIGSVPVLGNILVSRKGEGLFAINYRIAGSEEGLNIFVNPLSALTPGFLRRLFEIGAGDATKPPEPDREGTQPSPPTDGN